MYQQIKISPKCLCIHQFSIIISYHYQIYQLFIAYQCQFCISNQEIILQLNESISFCFQTLFLPLIKRQLNDFFIFIKVFEQLIPYFITYNLIFCQILIRPKRKNRFDYGNFIQSRLLYYFQLREIWNIQFQQEKQQIYFLENKNDLYQWLIMLLCK
ncbi:hypothetical protein pb186bvf_014256 [Paramecium bursaria]